MKLPPQVQALMDAISALPGVAGCFCGPKPLAGCEPSHLSLPGKFGDLPQAIIMRTNGGRAHEVMIQTEVILDRSPGAWLSLEFLVIDDQKYFLAYYFLIIKLDPMYYEINPKTMPKQAPKISVSFLRINSNIGVAITTAPISLKPSP